MKRKLLKFTKMHGTGNDYIYVDNRESIVRDPGTLAKKLSVRGFGIGADGLVLISYAENGNLRMNMFNADGSESENCGNALRCIAKYAHDNGLESKKAFDIEIMKARVHAEILSMDDEGAAENIRITFPPPKLLGCDVSPNLEASEYVEREFVIEAQEHIGTLVSVGNPHFVSYHDTLSDRLVHDAGRAIEMAPIFENRINVEFVRILNSGHVQQRTWERGSGETVSCGSGACAVCVAGVLSGKTANRLRIDLTGGSLDLQWDGRGQPLYITGEAKHVFTGEVPIYE